MRRPHDEMTLGGKARRLARIAAGLAKPATRERYLDAARKRLRPAEQSADPNVERCLVCGAAKPKHKTITYAKDPKKVFDVRICRRCGHVGNPENLHDYRNFKKLEKLPMRARVGTEDRKGREYHMAKMAVEIMRKRNLKVLIYGAGRSFDNRHIESLPGVESVAVADVMKLRDDAEFIDINKPAEKQFDLVIACEVVEHFLDPKPEFEGLLKFVAKGGLLLCSTNVYDGSDMQKHKYIFIEGHTSYYTPEALTYLARSNDYYIDFRVPVVATGYGGRRKRYLFVTKDASMLTDIACYFGKHMYAPSEGAWANKELAAQQEQLEQAKQRENDNAAAG